MAAADMAVKMGQPAAAVTEYDTMCFWVEDGSVRLAMLPFTTVAILPSLLATYSLTVPLLATDQLELELTFTSVLFSTHSLLLEYLLPATDYFVLLYTFSLYSHTLCWVEGLVSGAFDGSRVTPLFLPAFPPSRLTSLKGSIGMRFSTSADGINRHKSAKSVNLQSLM